MFRLAGVSASARPFVISGMALAMPPLPVLVPTPAPVRLNHSSSVKFGRVERRRGAERHVLARPVEAQGRAHGHRRAWRDGGRSAGDSWPSMSTAVTT